MGQPSNKIWPDVASIRPVITFIGVDLPEPFGRDIRSLRRGARKSLRYWTPRMRALFPRRRYTGK